MGRTALPLATRPPPAEFALDMVDSEWPEYQSKKDADAIVQNGRKVGGGVVVGGVLGGSTGAVVGGGSGLVVGGVTGLISGLICGVVVGGVLGGSTGAVVGG